MNICEDIRDSLLESAGTLTNLKKQVNTSVSHVIAELTHLAGVADIGGLSRPQKAAIGTFVEPQVLACLNLKRGWDSDTTILGHPVDIKFTVGCNWMIGKQQVGQWGILIRADKALRTCLGVVHLTDDALHSPNQDKKKRLSPVGRERILWLY